MELKPDAPLLRILLGQTLLAEDDPAKLDEAIVTLNRALVVEPDNPIAWQYLSQAYDAKGDEGMARLAAAEQNFDLGQMKDARAFAMRARELLQKGTPEWRRATDIVLVSKPSADDLRMLGCAGMRRCACSSPPRPRLALAACAAGQPATTPAFDAKVKAYLVAHPEVLRAAHREHAGEGGRRGQGRPPPTRPRPRCPPCAPRWSAIRATSSPIRAAR